MQEQQRRQIIIIFYQNGIKYLDFICIDLNIKRLDFEIIIEYLKTIQVECPVTRVQLMSSFSLRVIW